jgi:hypothetical protein
VRLGGAADEQVGVGLVVGAADVALAESLGATSVDTTLAGSDDTGGSVLDRLAPGVVHPAASSRQTATTAPPIRTLDNDISSASLAGKGAFT